MKITIVDEYGAILKVAGERLGVTHIPVVGDSWMFNNTEWVVTGRTWNPAMTEMIIAVEPMDDQRETPNVTEDNSGRLKDLQRAIVEVNKRQTVQEKKTRNLREQLVSMRSFLRNKEK